MYKNKQDRQILTSEQKRSTVLLRGKDKTLNHSGGRLQKISDKNHRISRLQALPTEDKGFEGDRKYNKSI